jgi:U6 snRNA-associated Sm-like protein LSm2
MIFFNFFQTLVEKQATVTVEMKNDVQLTGILESVDQFLNVKLANVKVKEEAKYPHLACLKNCFVRGSVVRYIHLKASDVDTATLQDKCRKEARDETR